MYPNGKMPQYETKTKHIVLKYHHFRSKVKSGLISVKYVNIDDQLADLLAKALSEAQFLKLRKGIHGW